MPWLIANQQVGNAENWEASTDNTSMAVQITFEIN